MTPKQSRKYLLTINNPKKHNLDHAKIKMLLSKSNPRYYCIVDEIGKDGTYHTHVFVIFHSPIRWTSIKHRFPEAHIDIAYGSAHENVDYLTKSGKWENSEKSETNLPDTFEEFGEIPKEKEGINPEMLEIIEDIEAGKTTTEIIKDHPHLALRTAKINELRETLRSDMFSEIKRNITVIYVFSGLNFDLIEYVYKNHHAKDICRITNYGKNGTINFDNYRGQKIIVFDDFKSSIPIESMNVYLCGYPCELPARYSNRAAAFETVYILSYLPLDNQYSSLKGSNEILLHRFINKIDKVVEFTEDGEIIERDLNGGIDDG